MMSKNELKRKKMELEVAVRNFLNEVELAVAMKFEKEGSKNLDCGQKDAEEGFKDLFESISCCIDELNE